MNTDMNFNPLVLYSFHPPKQVLMTTQFNTLTAPSPLFSGPKIEKNILTPIMYDVGQKSFQPEPLTSRNLSIASTTQPVSNNIFQDSFFSFNPRPSTKIFPKCPFISQLSAAQNPEVVVCQPAEDHSKMPDTNTLNLMKSKSKIEKGKIRIMKDWSYQDDVVLAQLVIQQKNDWKRIVKKFNSITNKKATAHFLKTRYRSLNNGPPKVRTKFSHQEDLIISKYILSHGPNWEQISRLLPSRTPMMIRNRYYSFIKKKGILEELAKAQQTENSRCPTFLSFSEVTDSFLSQEGKENEDELPIPNEYDIVLKINSSIDSYLSFEKEKERNCRAHENGQEFQSSCSDINFLKEPFKRVSHNEANYTYITYEENFKMDNFF